MFPEILWPSRLRLRSLVRRDPGGYNREYEEPNVMERFHFVELSVDKRPSGFRYRAVSQLSEMKLGAKDRNELAVCDQLVKKLDPEKWRFSLKVSLLFSNSTRSVYCETPEFRISTVSQFSGFKPKFQHLRKQCSIFCITFSFSAFAVSSIHSSFSFQGWHFALEV